ncbi:MAG: Ig-like domain-containing protein [Candidatus Marinimicrobia bacterium]|nr:Ig-like domain-containing protein [Candidatus Neomarinimicrobiota bacterium]
MARPNRIHQRGLLIYLLALSSLSAQVTGLSGWDIFIDPGHAGTEQNVGLFGYSEPECQLRVGLQLRDLLLTTTDIDTVYMSRMTDQDMATMDRSQSLLQRIDMANSLQASWYHSLHSNDGSSTANNVLMLWGQKSNGDEKAPIGGKAMSSLMLDKLSRGMRIPATDSFGDCDFYGGNNCPYLAVNRLTTMQSELSEAGFHTHPTQNQLKMSATWQRLEAYTFYWSILDYHNIARPTVGILTGIIKDKESAIPINGAVAAAGGLSDTTDTYESLFYQYSNDPDQLHNGFYFLDGIPEVYLVDAALELELVVSAPGYYPDTTLVLVVGSFFTFRDVQLLSSRPPYMTNSVPAEGDSLFPAWNNIVINFSRPMDAPTVEAAFTAPGNVGGAFAWSDGNRRMTFTPDTLDFLTPYTFSIGGTALDAYGHPFDGNGDGTGGDDLTVTFRTGPADLFPPEPIALYPIPSSAGVELLPLIALTFNEAVMDCTATGDRLDLVAPGGVKVPGTVDHYTVADRSVLHYFLDEPLAGNTRYVLWVWPGLRDLLGNKVTDLRVFNFTTGATTEDVTSIDNFESGVTTNWWQPTASGSNLGLAGSGNSRAASQTVLNLLTASTASMQLNYAWDTTATEFLLREYLGGGPPRSIQFNSSYIMQAYVFGDGSGNLLRFCVDDNLPATAEAYHEVSPWYTIDWIGWKLVSWDMANDGTGSWLGDGNLDGALRFDSFQLTYVPGAAPSGTLYFDDLRLIQLGIDLAAAAVPADFSLLPNYPNPFNPSTTITFTVPRRERVRLAVYDIMGRPVSTILTATIEPGRHQVVWDGRDAKGRNVATGVYIYRLETPSKSLARKMMLVK